MDEHDGLAARFETHRSHLRAVAYRMLGSHGEADDVVQDAWLRLSRVDSGGLDNLGGWLTTVVSRLCLDQLRTRKSRPEESLNPDAHQADMAMHRADSRDPEHELLLADSIGPALLVVLDTLAPAERLAFVLHDMFGVSFDEIGPIVDRSPIAARQLASRARRRVQGATDVPDVGQARKREIVAAFLAASRNGDFTALLALLDPAVVLRADAAALQANAARQGAGAPPLAAEARGTRIVVDTFSGRAHAARAALIDGTPGAVVALGGQSRVVFAFTIADDRITAIDLIADPARIGQFDVEILEG